MNKFSITKAKAGEKVITKCGFPVRIICFDRISEYPIVALIKDDSNTETLLSYTKKGKCYNSTDASELDLFMNDSKPIVKPVHLSLIEEKIKDCFDNNKPLNRNGNKVIVGINKVQYLLNNVMLAIKDKTTNKKFYNKSIKLTKTYKKRLDVLGIKYKD